VERTNQETQFAEWLDRHHPILRKVATVFATGADREDLMQEMMVSLWKALPGFRGDAKESTFIDRVAHNCALTWVRGENRRRHRETTAAEEHISQVGGAPPIDSRLELLYECLRELPAVDRSLITMSLDGLSHAEIGDIVGSTENAVSVRIHRLRKQLATAMERKGTHYEY
jgi:RNA polymerase sigma-70 factor (ECF subfamily)